MRQGHPSTAGDDRARALRPRAALTMLVLIYTCNFIDRTILATLGQAIKVDLEITDTQLGLLQGLAFAIFYTALGIPLARLSEHVNRVSLISVSVAIWSAMTALSGTAANFVQLFLYRIGVGVGEAGCSPPAHSLIADLYPAERRASALAVYSFGIPLGTMIGAMSGGWLVDNFSWRVALLVVGLPGLVLALVFRVVAREPERGRMDEQPATIERPGVLDTARHVFGNPAFVHITIGATLVGFVGYGTGTFAQAYFIRMYDLSFTQVGLAFGLVGGISAGVGTLLGGFMADVAGRRRRYWYALLPAIALLIATPTYVIAFTRDLWLTAIWWMLLPGLFHYAYIGPTLGTMHNIAEQRMRAMATALFFVVVNLIGLGLGPYATGAVIDMAVERRFGQAGFSDFVTACPGGIAPEGASAALASACASASAFGTRDGIVVVLFVFLWAAGHYCVAARKLGWLRRAQPTEA